MTYFRSTLLILFSILTTNYQVHAKGAKAPVDAKPQLRTDLKKLIQIDKIKAQPVIQNGNMIFDLENAASRQFLSSILTSNRFTAKWGTGGTLTMGNSGQIELISRSMPANMGADESCLIDKPQLKVSGEILGMELESTSGANLNFFLPFLPIGGGGFNYKVAKTRMTAVFDARDSAERRVMAAATVSETQKESQSGFNLSFQELAKFGFDYYKKTPLSSVTQKVLDKGIAQIDKQTKDLEWEAPVVYSQRKIVGINAGIDAGIKVKDEFSVQNMIHRWSGVPCQSQYLGSIPDVYPVAIVRIYDVQATESYAQVIELRDADAAVLPGARVKISKLYNPESDVQMKTKP